ncbi:hypothetical protein ABTX81_27590 [Kitasatospora sp. NPDC097605]|uniref:hypothetical protein n=1 Tax=Kitasatospora sp. NPDC097605 TaxID=3157226 RepID=UPI003328BEF5
MAEHELPIRAAVVVTVLVGRCGGVVLLAVLHGRGWTVPGLGRLVAEGAAELGVGGAVGPTAAVARLRVRRAGRGADAS